MTVTSDGGVTKVTNVATSVLGRPSRLPTGASDFLPGRLPSCVMEVRDRPPMDAMHGAGTPDTFAAEPGGGVLGSVKP